VIPGGQTMTYTLKTRAETRYFQILDTAPDAMVVVGRDETIVFVNAQTEKVFGYTRAELLGKPLDILLPVRFRGAHSGHVARYFSRPVVRSMGSGVELFGLRADGTEIGIEVSLSPVEIAEGVLVSAAIRDITERKRMDAAARLNAARLASAVEAGSAAKSDFLSSMSHELRTPLNAILGFAQLLQRDKKEPLSARHQERVEQILKGGAHLLRLIDDILDLSHIEAGGVSISTEPVSVSDVLDEVRRTLGPMAARSGIAIEVVARPATVAADRMRFAQILMNFGSNAIKYNRPKGRVTFTVSLLSSEDRVRVTVSDTGMGIAADKHDKLFQPFQRAGQEMGPIEGTGIGLVISKRLAELMSGDVGFRSVAGKGSSFWIDLPAHASKAPPSIPTVRGDAHAVRKETDHLHLVLYVEDNPANVSFMKDLVTTFDFIDLVAAPTAEMGVELARARQPEVIIMDINLPGMSGLDALQLLREWPETKHIPVIALTAAASDRDKQRGLAAGFYKYLTKPVKVDELLAALEELLTPK
jgi:PAS domain S-box-containing protein